MTLERRPTTPIGALLKLPDRTHPDYKISDGAYEHIANFRESLMEFFSKSASGELENVPLSHRSFLFRKNEVTLILKMGSFYRNLETDFTVDWAHINGNEWQKDSFATILPFGDDNYRWWQITTLVPDVTLGDFRLYSVETNDKFKPQKTEYRYDENSEFTFLLAHKSEIEALKLELSHFDY